MKDFSKYLKDGRRVAAFGQQHDNEIEVFLLYCSKKDHFSKKLANAIYSMWFAEGKQEKFLIGYKQVKEIYYEKTPLNDLIEHTRYVSKPTYAHPVVFRILIKEEDSAQYTFSRYMNENFYRKVTTELRVKAERDYLKNKSELVPISNYKLVIKF